MHRFFLSFLILLFLIISPFLIGEVWILKMKPAYADSFSAALIDKAERLKSSTGQKIILIGGSSLPFGIRSDLIEKHLGGEVIDFGLYANLGTKAMLDLSKINIARDDIVILAPEVSRQTYSLFFNPRAMWEAIEEDVSLIRYLPPTDRIRMLYNSYPFGLKKLSQSTDTPLEEPYARSAFNQYGDIKTSRPYNIMPFWYDKSMPILMTKDLPDEGFIRYLNEYIRYCEKQGADVFFTFSPMNDLAVSIDSRISDFTSLLEEKLDCEILGTPETFIYDHQYFYDTNYHLNDAGSILHTKHLIELLKEKYGIHSATDIAIPEPGIRPDGDIIEGDNTYVDYFEYTMIGNSYYISSVKEEYRDLEKVVIPATYQNVQIAGINTMAFDQCNKLQEIRIYRNIRILDMKMFSGCGALTKIYVYAQRPNELLVPASDLLTGANPDVKIYIQEEYLRRFQSDYTWSVYGDSLRGFQEEIVP